MKTVLTLGAALLLGACVTATQTPVSPSPTATPSTASVSTSGFDGLLARERINARLPALRATAALNAVAQAHAQDMATGGYFGHQSPSGTSFSDRVKSAGIRNCGIAENIAYGPSSAAEVMSTWMESAGHRANILNGGMTSYGLGQAGDKWVLVMVKPC